MPSGEPPEQSQFAILVRHFLDRFLNNEMASSDGEGKTRLIQVACAAGLPGFVAAMYLWPVYHDMFKRQRPYWTRVGDHYLFVVYSLVAMGIIMIFEWDLFFPDSLDMFVLSSLPIGNRKLFVARIATIVIFVIGFLFDANILSTLALPAAIDPPSLGRFLAAHILAVTASGIFAAAVVLAVQGVLLAVLGARFFRSISLFLQGFFITVLIMVLFLFPVVSDGLPVFMHSHSTFALYFPPFWFLGIYQRLMEGPLSLPIYAKLAHTGVAATFVTAMVAMLSYPFAYWRRTRELMEGSAVRDTRSLMARPMNALLHATICRVSARRAIYHFINQTLLRVQRYRIYLIMYSGMGMALVTASVVRLNVVQGHFRIDVSPDGVRTAIPMAAFWTIAGLRMAFVSPGGQRGGWIFRVIHGKPALNHLVAARTWVLAWSMAVTLGTVAVLHVISPAELHGWSATTEQVLVAAGLCLLLTDVFFLKVKTIPFTGVRVRSATNLAFVLIPYIGAFPPLVFLTVACEPWMEVSAQHMIAAVLLIIAVHMGLRTVHRRSVEEQAQIPELDEDEEEFPMKLGLRY